MLTRRRKVVTGLVVVGAIALSGWVLQKMFGHIAVADVEAAVRAQPISRLWASLALTVLSFACLAFYDLVGARIVAARRVSARAALFAGAVANAVSNTLGFHVVTGSVIRMHIYRRSGLTHVEVARMVSLTWLALGVGFVTLLALAEWQRFASGQHPAQALLTGAAIAVALVLFVFWLSGGERRLSLFGFTQPLPSARLAMLQMGVGALESAAAIGALYVLLPADLAPSFGLFALGSIAAIAMGVIAHTPGGIGVFEASVTAFLGGAGRADLLAGLLLYRVIYNLVPFAVSIVALGCFSLTQRGRVNSTAGIG